MIKVMHILTVNISKMETDRANITIAKYEVRYGLSMTIQILSWSIQKVKFKVMHIYTAKFVTVRANIILSSKTKSQTGFLFVYLNMTLGHSKGQKVTIMSFLIVNISKLVTDSVPT